ncbi:hypothetical protein [Cellulomonas sp. URHD0024]|uniref:hypothetical protein n=1 Tax=Cellulomonas sp. URHD0024 TaxID=1302620 RepID=UPI000423BFE8|nr:hypothetical protein [Cellulomonas sp. URHD0024]
MSTIPRRTLAVLGATVLIVTGAGAAQASVASSGTGFVGKGDVQSALGWNNAKLQDNAEKLTFTTKQAAAQGYAQALSQAAEQAGTQTASQTGSQTGTQSASLTTTELLSCRKTNGAVAQQSRTGVKSGVRSDTREATVTDTREASRDAFHTGSRTGSRAGTLVGFLNSNVAYEARKSNQFTGFNLTGFQPGSPSFSASGPVQWGADAFGDWSFGDWVPAGDYAFPEYVFGEYEFEAWSLSDAVWGNWDTDNTNQEPDVCLNSSGNVNANVDPASLVHIFTDGPLVESAVQSGAVRSGAIVEGEVVPGLISEAPIQSGPAVPGAVGATGPAQLFVNGVLLPSIA